MISLGQSSENKQCSLENIIVDDVNTSNLELMKQWYSKATVYVDKRFETPTSKSIVVTSRSASMHKILDKISKVDLGNESQTENFRLKTRNWCIGQFRELFKKLDNGEDAVLFIDSTPSKHECTYIKWLAIGGWSWWPGVRVSGQVARCPGVRPGVQVSGCPGVVYV